MIFRKRLTLSNREYYVCNDREQEYRIDEYIWPDGSVTHVAQVWFARVTSNVFGNGSTDVHQSGWRRLPPGPVKRRLLTWFELRKRRNELLA